MIDKLIAGTGSVLIDVLIYENDEFLDKIGAVKGGMKFIENEFIDSVLKQASSKPAIVPGGSACNTMIGIGKLGGKARFIGKSGEDDMGKFFETYLNRSSVESVLFTSSSPTGRVLSVITPDAQRSMLTFLGASSEAMPDEITEKCFKDAVIVHIEGYMLFNIDLMMASLLSAKKAGALVSLDLASFTIVEKSKGFLEKITDEFVDILIANEDEALAFTGFSNELKAIEVLSKKADIAVLKIGAKGSYISRGGQIIRIRPSGDGQIVDTTGAGDLWASGFLFGVVHDFSLEKCGEIGSACGYEVCRVIGASIPDEGWKRIKQVINR